MGYFSNGTEGEAYVARYCSRCVHHRPNSDTTGCPVMAAHILYAYDEADTGSRAEQILDMLIPNEGPGNGECRLFTLRVRG